MRVKRERDEIDTVLIQREKENNMIKRKLMANRVGNFVRTVLSVSKTYEIQTKVGREVIKPTVAHPETVFYKLYRIYCPTISIRPLLKLGLIFGLFRFVKFRYDTYCDTNSKESLDYNGVDFNTYKPRSILYDKNTDERYLQVYRKEQEYLEKAVDLGKIILQSEDSPVYSEADQAFFLKLQMLKIHEISLILGILALPFCYVLYRRVIKKSRLLSQDVINSVIITLIAHEILSYVLTFNSYITKMNQAPEVMLENNPLEILKYQLFKDQLNNLK